MAVGGGGVEGERQAEAPSPSFRCHAITKAHIQGGELDPTFDQTNIQEFSESF